MRWAFHCLRWWSHSMNYPWSHDKRSAWTARSGAGTKPRKIKIRWNWRQIAINRGPEANGLYARYSRSKVRQSQRVWLQPASEIVSGFLTGSSQTIGIQLKWCKDYVQIIRLKHATFLTLEHITIRLLFAQLIIQVNNISPQKNMGIYPKIKAQNQFPEYERFLNEIACWLG